MRPGSLRRTLALAKWPFGEADRLDPPRVPDHVIVFGEAHLSIAMSFERICPQTRIRRTTARSNISALSSLGRYSAVCITNTAGRRFL
jgi:hypothetical protein